MVKLKTSIVYFAACIASPLTSFSMQAEPTHCPGVEAIKQVPFNRAQVDYFLGWAAVTPVSTYDTQGEWTTAMIIGKKSKDTDEQSVLNEANSYLPLITANGRPPERNPDGWWCYYSVSINNSQIGIFSVMRSDNDLGEKLAKISAQYQRLHQ